MTVRLICMLTAILSTGSLATGSAAAAAEQPRYNVLLFTADDMHAESMQNYGSQVKDLTPNLDRFAKTGMVFDRAHVNAAICAPSRAVIATGLYSHNSGAMGFMPARPGTPDIVTSFQQANYLAGILGKVGHSTPVPGMTWDYQFDRRELGNGRSPTLYYERSTVFFKRCKSEGKPFYFMVNSHDPHRPYCNPAKLTTGAEAPSKTYEPEDVEVPGFVPDLPGVRRELAMYQNSVRRLDDTFGKVMQALDESGFADTTLVVFMSDNGIAIPFAKCNAWFHSTRTPMVVRLPRVVKPGTRDDTHFVSGVDLMPTFLELASVPGPKKLDGRSMLPLLMGTSQGDREFVFTQIDSKAGGDAVPMRCVQNGRFGYIYNPFSDGKHRYRNNNEGQTMAAMNAAAETDPRIAKRVHLFRYRVPEEFYDLEKDPNCLVNLIDAAEHAIHIQEMRKKLDAWMVDTKDPMLEAFRSRDDRAAVDAVLEKTYGKPKQRKNGRKNL
jgi:N-sulfoglucosamine sulfohydrolase